MSKILWMMNRHMMERKTWGCMGSNLMIKWMIIRIRGFLRIRGSFSRKKGTSNRLNHTQNKKMILMMRVKMQYKMLLTTLDSCKLKIMKRPLWNKKMNWLSRYRSYRIRLSRGRIGCWEVKWRLPNVQWIVCWSMIYNSIQASSLTNKWLWNTTRIYKK